MDFLLHWVFAAQSSIYVRVRRERNEIIPVGPIFIHKIN